MFKNKTVGVVVPAYNEEKLIGRVIETMPDFVDKIIIVDDKSQDKTREVVISYQKNYKKVVLLSHDENQGVGGAIITGYKEAVKEGLDIVAVMAGDAQMDPDDLIRIIEPVAADEVDYTKGNRLFYGDAWNIIPHYRYLGNSFLSLMTKVASGYWHIADSQSGYTAISLIALERIDVDRIYKRYGMPNDILIELNLYDFKVRDIHIRPVYNVGERSGIKLMEVIPKISWILFKGFCKRLVFKYVIKDFHPLIFFYLLSFILLGLSIPLTIRLFFIWAISGDIPDINAMALIFTIVTGLQSLFFGMWFDMEKNKDLK
jgi:glycosyltransferase involved in cell wall biosynthesis